MASTTAASAPSAAAASATTGGGSSRGVVAVVHATAQSRRTYWCHECDMSVTLSPPSPPRQSLLCPHCRGDFLEEMDSIPAVEDDSDADDDDSVNDGDLFLAGTTLQNAADRLDRLIFHLAGADPDEANPLRRRPSRGASRSSIDSIPTVKIAGGGTICAVCKDEFVESGEAKQLPCRHVYHSDCILPWLSNHNSCPVCRFRLPVEEEEVEVAEEGRDRSRPFTGFRDLMDDRDDLMGLQNTLRHIARRRGLFSMRLAAGVGAEAAGSPTQMGSVAAQDNSGETVSSWPVGGGGSGGSGGVRAGVDEEGDTVMSEVRGVAYD
ncbi:E3 ubiquitin-protein ligase RING1-like [Acorus gramineus]|uniref:RING-type E3 ubiquitin transferase n=1 Tax=Acorus gramineus TaxID=55184 RepID=A0AAV9AFR3_ACOGR|nr:E3 ubiquitin-protein ligase RING1-like [Acorus gramineus]